MYKEEEGYYGSAYGAKEILKNIDKIKKDNKKEISKNIKSGDIFNSGINSIVKLIRETNVEFSKTIYIDYIQNVFEHKPEKTNKELKENIKKLQHIGDNNSIYFIGKYNYLIKEYEKAAENLKKYIKIE